VCVCRWHVRRVISTHWSVFKLTCQHIYQLNTVTYCTYSLPHSTARNDLRTTHTHTDQWTLPYVSKNVGLPTLKWYSSKLYGSIFRTFGRSIQNTLKIAFVCFRFHVGLLVITLSSLKLHAENSVHAVRFSQLLSAPFLAALETQSFVNNPRNWWSIDPPPHVIFLWVFGVSEVCLPDSATATQLCRRFHQYAHCTCKVDK